MSKEVDNLVKDIKDVKIQGANEIALAGIRVVAIHSDKNSINKILSTRSTEPLLQNSLKIIRNSINKKKTAKKLIGYIEDSKFEIARKGAKLIKNNMNIFSHCHSSSVMEILKYAKKFEKKEFVVYTLEVEPLLQGRKTARELAKAGIKVIIFPDLAAEQALSKCDLFLFGADAFLKGGVVNKLGTSLLCELAKTHSIPHYSCGVSLKYTNKVKIEKRSGKEVWNERNKNIDVENPAFDFTKKKYLTGVISELGVKTYSEFIKFASNTFNILNKIHE